VTLCRLGAPGLACDGYPDGRKPKEAATRRYLVVANQTLVGDELVREIVARAEAEPSEFFIVVPVTPVLEMWVEAAAVPYCGILGEPSTPEQARKLAGELHQDLPHRLQQFDLPVTHVVAVKHAALPPPGTNAGGGRERPSYEA